jgi:hypothetical protein
MHETHSGEQLIIHEWVPYDYRGKKPDTRGHIYDVIRRGSANPLSHALASLFSTEIDIMVAPEGFTFRAGDSTETIATHVWLSRDERQILAIGDMPPTTAHVVVHLFRTTASRDYSYCPADALEAFLRYGLQRMCQRQPFPKRWIRPTVTFRNTDSLEPYLNGYQQVVLATATMQAGVPRCRFVS